MKRFFLFLIGLLLPFIVQADKIKEDFTIPTNSIKADIVEWEDGNYYVAGTVGYNLGGVLKYNSNHELINSKRIGNYKYCYSLDLDEEGNIYTVCQLTTYYPGTGDERFDKQANEYARLVLVKLDKEFNIIYEKDFLSENDKSYDGIIKIFENNIYYFDLEKIYDRVLYDEDKLRYINYKSNYYITKFNFDGEIVSRKKVLNNDIDLVETFFISRDIYTYQSNVKLRYNMEIHGDYVYFVVGDDGSNDANRHIVAKYKIGGNVIWSHEFLSDEIKYVKNITLTNDNKVIVVGTKGNNPVLVTLDANSGEVIENKTLEGVQYALLMFNVDDGYYALYTLKANSPYGNETQGSYLIRFDYDFNVKDMIKTDNYQYGSFGKADDKGVYLYSYDISHYYTEKTKYESVEREIYITDSLKIEDVYNSINVNEWVIDDSSIVEIKDNVIIPKALGETYLTGIDDNTVYKLLIRVLEKPEEPPKEEPPVEEEPKKEEEPKQDESKQETKQEVVSSKPKQDETEDKNPNTIDIVKVVFILMICSLSILLISYVLFKHKKIA